jgi:uncharacterized protein with HEPN domain
MKGQPRPVSESDYLKHILEAINRIQKYVASLTYEDFIRDTREQDAVIRNLEVVGEASRNIERRFPGFATGHPELSIRAASDMRNALSHGYFGVDLEIVWRTIHTSLPPLKQAILALLTK